MSQSLLCEEIGEVAISEQDVGIGVPPWISTSYDPLSWWSMLQFSARQFYYAGSSLEQLVTDAYLASSTEYGFCDLGRLLDAMGREKAYKRLAFARDQFESIGLRITGAIVQETIHAVADSNTPRSLQWLIDEAKRINSVATKEMEGIVFFFVPADRAQFFPRKDKFLFGSKVHESFPKALNDIHEAGRCLALRRSTASVFHAMRVLEFGLSALGNVFDVSLAHTNWQPAITEIERKIRAMHTDPSWRERADCKQKQEAYSQMASHFGILKDAWRNYTMHSRGKYTEEEAEGIFRNVRDFMQKLAEGGLHE